MNNWPEIKLGDLGKIIRGSSPRPKGDPRYYGGDVPRLMVADVTRDGMYVTPKIDFLTKEGAKKSRPCEKGTLVIQVSGNPGTPAILDVDCCIHDGFAALINTSSETIITEYLFYCLERYKIENQSKSVGAIFKNLTTDQLRNFDIPLPPIEIQKRLVKKLNSVSKEIHIGLELIQRTSDYAHSLMGSVLDEIFSNGDNALKDLCIIGPKKSEVKHLDSEELVSFLPMKDLNEHDINFTAKESRKIGDVYRGYTYFKENDIILAKVTPCFENGKAGVAKKLTNGIGFGSSEYHILRANEGVVPEWIYYGILAEQFRVTGKENMTGSGGLKRVPKSFIEEWKIPLPSITVQQREVDRIIEIQNYTRRMQSKVDQQLNDLVALKKSVLDQAFKGKLS